MLFSCWERFTRRKPASTRPANAWILTCSQPREQKSPPAAPAWPAAGGPSTREDPRHLLPGALTGLTWALPAREGMERVCCNHRPENQQTRPPLVCQHCLPERAPCFKAVTWERRGFALLLCVRRLRSRRPAEGRASRPQGRQRGGKGEGRAPPARLHALSAAFLPSISRLFTWQAHMTDPEGNADITRCRAPSPLRSAPLPRRPHPSGRPAHACRASPVCCGAAAGAVVLLLLSRAAQRHLVPSTATMRPGMPLPSTLRGVTAATVPAGTQPTLDPVLTAGNRAADGRRRTCPLTPAYHPSGATGLSLRLLLLPGPLYIHDSSPLGQRQRLNFTAIERPPPHPPHCHVASACRRAEPGKPRCRFLASFALLPRAARCGESGRLHQPLLAGPGEPTAPGTAWAAAGGAGARSSRGYLSWEARSGAPDSSCSVEAFLVRLGREPKYAV